MPFFLRPFGSVDPVRCQQTAEGGDEDPHPREGIVFGRGGDLGHFGQVAEELEVVHQEFHRGPGNCYGAFEGEAAFFESFVGFGYAFLNGVDELKRIMLVPADGDMSEAGTRSGEKSCNRTLNRATFARIRSDERQPDFLLGRR